MLVLPSEFDIEIYAGIDTDLISFLEIFKSENFEESKNIDSRYIEFLKAYQEAFKLQLERLCYNKLPKYTFSSKNGFYELTEHFEQIEIEHAGNWDRGGKFNSLEVSLIASECALSLLENKNKKIGCWVITMLINFFKKYNHRVIARSEIQSYSVIAVVSAKMSCRVYQY